MSTDLLTAAERTRVCWRVAGSAVIHALGLGGAKVVRVGVSPAGATEPYLAPGEIAARWQEHWGRCDILDDDGEAPELRYVSMDTACEAPGSHWLAFTQDLLKDLAAMTPAEAHELLRSMRARVCGAVAGPIAEHNAAREAVDLLDLDVWRDHTDVQHAASLALCAGGQDEFARLIEVTRKALAEPAILAFVAELAGALQWSQPVVPLSEWLPQPRMDWPPPGASSLG